MSTVSPESLRVGMDLVSVEEVAASVDHFGDRYVMRLFTPHEIETCRTGGCAARGRDAYAVDSLAARREVSDYHLLHAARGSLLARLGRNSEARDAGRKYITVASKVLTGK